MGMTDSARRRRDPEARRLDIIAAAAELIVEVGADAITHRMIAARAGVPLGATTQHFATLDDVRTAALHFLSAELDANFAAIKAALDERGVGPAAIAELLSQVLVDARAVQADRAVVTAAVHDPRVRELARRASAHLVEFLSPAYGVDRATAAAVFIDGVMWNAQINDAPLDIRLIETALTGLLCDPVSLPSASSD